MNFQIGNIFNVIDEHFSSKTFALELVFSHMVDIVYAHPSKLFILYIKISRN